MLLVSEILAYMQPNISEELFVDTSRGHKLRINLDFTVPRVSCDYLTLDAMDSSGDQHLHIDQNVYKRKLGLEGNPLKETATKEEITTAGKGDTKSNKTECGSCYGAASRCCNTCEEVIAAYREKRWEPNPDAFEQCKEQRFTDKLSKQHALKEGCQIYGHIEVNRVGGGFHIAPGKSFSLDHIHVHDVQPFSSTDFNVSHIINHLSFGDRIEVVNTHPLDGMKFIANEASMMFQYYVKIVPTMYVRQNGQVISTNQFSVTINKKVVSLLGSEKGMPGIFFSYELSPLMVKYTEKGRSLGHLATNICSIVGGVFTVAGIIVSLLHSSMYVIREKLELGKLS